MGKMKLKSFPTSQNAVWVVSLKHKAGPLLAAQLADGTLVASMFVGGRSQGSILREWQRRWPQLCWQTGKPPKPANMAAGAPLGTDFQCAVWQKTATIPDGTVLTYGDIAAAVGRPRAARAVGTALKLNPLIPFVPCHRVVGSQGGLGGYSGAGGLATKRKLLRAEHITLKE